MSRVKPLYLAKSLSELNEKVDTKSLDGATPKILCRMADKLLLKAKDESLTGDEEQAYVLYMRFVDVVKAVRASKEYRANKKEFDKSLPSQRIGNAVTNAEALSASLQKRYSELNKEEDQVVPESEVAMEGEESMAPAGDRGEVMPSTPPPLTPTKLYSLLTTSPAQVLVLDCRTRASFNSSHPESKKFPQWLGIPEESVVKGLTDQSATAFLTSSGKKLWKDRSKMSHVVLVDESSTAAHPHTPLLALRDALTKWESATPLAPPNPYLLEGGYNMWYLSYQVICTGRYKPVQRSEVKKAKAEEDSDTLSYPTFEDSPELEPTAANHSSISIYIDAMETTEPRPNVVMETNDRQHNVAEVFGQGRVLGTGSYGSVQEVEVNGEVPHMYVPSNQVNPLPVHPVDMYLPSFPPLPTFAPPVPLVSLEGEAELLAPNLTDEVGVVEAIEPLDDYHDNQNGFGIVADEAYINTPLPGGHAPLFYEQPGMMQPQPGPYPHIQPGPHPHVQQLPQSGPHPPMQQGLPPPTQQGPHPPMQQGPPPPTQQGPHPPMQQGPPPPTQQEPHPLMQQGPPPYTQQGPHPPIQPGPHPQVMNPPQSVYPPPGDVRGQALLLPQPHGQAPPPPQPHEELASQQNPAPQTVPPLVLQRMIEGPIPNPPTYEQSHNLPSLPPVQPPIPPPVSTNPPNQLVQSQQAPAIQVVDPKEARIKELEERLTNMERMAHKARAEDQRRLKEQIDQEKARLEAETRRQTELARQQLAAEQERSRVVMESQRRALEEERQRMTMERGQLTAMKDQMERERVQIEEAVRQHAARAQLEKRRREEQQRVFSLQGGLPPNWEKRLDSTTGRFYYVDHDTKTTHWNPPTNWINYQRARQEEQERRKHPQPTPPQPSQHPSPTQSTQRPPTQLPPTQPPQPPPTQPSQPPPTQLPQPPPTQPSTHPPPTQPSTGPVVDRSAKPEAPPTQPTVPDRSKKPSAVARQPVLMTPAMQRQKQQNLQAVFGTGRYVLTGLRNLGNTCYMNSTLQCLACTTPVIRHFITGEYQVDINFSNPLGTRGQVATEFAWLMKALWSGSYKSVSPRDFKDMIGRYVPQMKGSDQQDSQEFLAFLLDSLHEDLNKVKKKVYIAEPENGLDDVKSAELAWMNHQHRNNSVIVDHFQGMFRSQIKCNGCGKSSVTFEPFMYLSLPIPPGQGPCSLEDCVKLFIKSETVEWNCSNCKDPRGHAVKKMDIWRLPPVLLIHLKRFSYQGMWKEKRQNTVSYPTDTNLDMSRFIASPQTNHKQFTLYGVSNHFGTLTGGHYTACCRNPYNRQFYNFDDQEVKEALPRQLKSAAAYILYYSAVDLTPGRVQFSK